ncbi:MAG: WecB/TagA/CpsF family glycosyltransferase [Wenzhouxiangella sp.]|nr:MAG: WecB/TagA/CpsF family glycosyltransferase [Wenzhouxiangella sp.]
MNPTDSRASAAAPRAGWQDKTMRLLDIVLALAVLLPALPLLALALPGASWQHETWRGRHGQPVRLASLKLTAGLRGRLLGRLHIDRLPLLLSILKGQLAWVGPRAVALDEAIPRRLRATREQVRPGLFSLYTLRQRTSIDYDSEWACDAEQLAERGLRHDLGILVRNLLAGLYGQAAITASEPGLVDTVRVHPLTMNETLDAIERHRTTAGFLQLGFANPDCINIARRNARYRNVLNQAGLVVPDGIGMRLAGRLLKRGFRQNVNGTDLFPRLCQRLAGNGGRLFLLGGQPGVAEATADWVRHNHPDLTIAGTHHGYFDAAEEKQVIEQIRASRADVLLVAMGAPRQELWIHEHAENSGVRVAMGVGGLFDFYAGRIPRAPQWLREIGAEWLYRLYQEPGRMWRRYLVGNISFMTAVLMQRWLGSVELAQLAGDESVVSLAPQAKRAMLLMDFPASDAWMAGEESNHALLPLGDRPLLYRSLESLAGMGCQEVRILASHGLGRIREEVGTGARWGMAVTVEAVRGCADARKRIERTKLGDDESIWVVRADHWLPAQAIRGGDKNAVWVYLDDTHSLQWTGWALIGMSVRREFLAALDRNKLTLHRLPEHLDRIGAQAPLRFDQPHSVLEGQRQWLGRTSDAYDLHRETAPGIRIAATARVAPGARLIAPLEIGANSIVGSEASLGPNVVIGSDCRIEGDVEIRDSLVADQVALRGPAQLEQAIATRAGLLNIAHAVWLPARITGDLLRSTRPALPRLRIGIGERLLALVILVVSIVPAVLLRSLGKGGDFSQRVLPGLSTVIAGRLALVGVGEDHDLPDSITGAGWREALAEAPRGLVRPRDALGLEDPESAAWADVHWLVQPTWRERLRLLRGYFVPPGSQLVTVRPQSAA